MAIDVSGKTFVSEGPDRLPGARRFFFISLLVLFLLLLVTAGVLTARSEVRRSIERTKQEFETIQAAGEAERGRILGLERRLGALRRLLETHVKTSRVLGMLEARTHQNVSYEAFSFDEETPKLELKGRAPNFAVLAEQLAAWEQTPQIERVEAGEASKGSPGGVLFSARLFLSPKSVFGP